MCGNRVEELETRVQELEASVEGLTDELVECKVRLRELESAFDGDLGLPPAGSEPETADIEPDDSAVGVEMVDASTEDHGDADSTAEGTKTEADNSDDKTEDSESDIIVA
jgi:hypothetical protein